MRHIRFTMSSLLVVVLFVGFGFAALREANEIWDSSCFSFTLGVLLVSIVFAINRTEKRRAFWLGVALFGWIYLGLSLVPSIESRLITTRALACLDSKVQDAFSKTVRAGATVSGNQNERTIKAPFQGSIVKSRNPDDLTSYYKAFNTMFRRRGSGKTENFVRIGHSLMALLIAWFGGQLSRYAYTKNREGNIEAETSGGVDLE